MKYIKYTILAIILLIILTTSMTNSCKTFRPASKNVYKNYAAFEGFNDGSTSAMDYSKNSTEQKVMVPTVDFFNKQTAKKVEGFGGLQSSPYEKEKKLDIFSGTSGSTVCDGKSFNLSNSQGGLCLDEKQTRLMRTRGGNAESGDSQIGS